MAPAKLEHVNITVTDNAATAQHLIEIYGWHQRWQGPSSDGGHSIHVGTDAHYIAVYTPPPNCGRETRFEKGAPLNHICLEVADLDATQARLIAAGYVPFNHGDYEPGRRFYYYDDNGIEYEVVSYQ